MRCVDVAIRIKNVLRHLGAPREFEVTEGPYPREQFLAKGHQVERQLHRIALGSGSEDYLGLA